MKTKLTRTASIIGLVLGLGAAGPARGDTAAAAPQEKSLKGVVAAVSQPDKTIRVKNFWHTRTMNLADDCKVVFQDKPAASPADLRPGQQVEVRFEDAQGVLVAREIMQKNQTYRGYIASIDPAKRVLVVRHRMLDKTFRIADDCRVVLRDEKAGAPGELQPGQSVMLVFETPDGVATAREITQHSKTFNGSLTAIDLNERTLKARAFLGSRKFSLSSGCRIVIEGKPDGELRDLRIGDRVVFNYEDVNGVLVADRVGRETGTATEDTQAAKSSEYSSSRPAIAP